MILRRKTLCLTRWCFLARRAMKITLAAQWKRWEGIRVIKKSLPDTRTILGISNVSFGLPAGAREVVNSVFLYYCTKAGLDLAIVNTEKLERFASIPEHERELAENLLFQHPPKNIREGHPRTELLRNAPADWREAE